MNQYKIIIEETISQEFEVSATTAENALKIAKQKYKNSEFVLEPGYLTDVRYFVANEQ